MRDNLDLLVKRLGRLLDVLEQKEFGGSVTKINKESVTVNQTRTDEPTDDNTPTYFSTGPERKAVENTEEWERLGFGFVAETINIRTTDDVLLAFSNPQINGPQLKLRKEESPFTIGGDSAIDTAFLWVKQAESAGSTPGIEILAYE